MKHLLLTTIAAVVLVGCGSGVDIWTAAQTGNIEVVKQHLADGVDVNSKSDMGRTSLDVAIAFKQSLITDLLRKHGGKTRDELKAAELIGNAIEVGSIEVVKQHLAAGMDVNAKDSRGWTPLHLAADQGHKKVAELLLAKGANVNAKNRQGWTPLMVAAERGDVDIANLLVIKESDLNSHKRGWTSLHRAAYYNKVEIAAFLIELGLDVNARDDQGQTPLHWPANYGRVQMVKYLISRGADVNAVAMDGIFSGRTPLDAAIKDNQGAVAELLKRHGGKTAEELEAIIDAAKKGDIETVKQHLAAGTDVNTKNSRGWTPLHLATDQGHKEVVELLLAKGANVNAKDDKGRTTLDWAEEENKEITDLLHKHGGKTGKELKKLEAVKESIHAAARYGNIEAVKQHLAAGTDVSFRNKNGDTPLNYAAFLGHMEIVELLVENGANVNAKGLADWTPLHLAAHNNKEKIVQLLIANGAEVNPYTSPDFGGTPLDVANGKIADLLRKHGGNTSGELKAEGK